jgi:hypothetical protein
VESEKRQENDYTSSSFYTLPWPMPVSDVLLLEPRIIILLRYTVRASLMLLKRVALRVGLASISDARDFDFD